MDQDKRNTLENRLIGKQLLEIDCYNINDNFFVFEEDGMAIVDGGVTLSFAEDGFSLGWNHEIEIHNMTTEPITTFFGDLDFYQIDKGNFPFTHELLGKRIRGIDTEWSWYQLLDENMELSGPEYDVLLGLILYFEDDQTLQLAATDYQLTNEGASEFRYQANGELLLSANRIIDISAE